MARNAHELDLAGLRLAAGEGRRLTLQVPVEPIELGGERYLAQPLEHDQAAVPVELSVSRMSGGGYALRLRFAAVALGPCMRCLKPAGPQLEIDAREVDVAGAADELDSPYVRDEVLDLAGWAHDAFALAMPTKILCREDCAGLCPTCAADLNEAGPEHRHESAPDPRWSKLRELRLE